MKKDEFSYTACFSLNSRINAGMRWVISTMALALAVPACAMDGTERVQGELEEAVLEAEQALEGPPVCGNGILEVGESCDDGNTSEADDCSSACTEQKVLGVVGGYRHTCARLSGGALKCWGGNESGELGTGDAGYEVFPATIYNRGDQPNEMGSNLPYVFTGGVQAIEAGNGRSIAAHDNGALVVWGINPDYDGAPTPPGHEPYLPSPSGALLPDVIGVAASMHNHFCALLANGTVKCWGGNSYGELGLGYKGLGRNLPMSTNSLGGTAVAISTGSAHSCALLGDGSVKCWGYNGCGQLGLGDAVDRHAPTVAVDLGAGRTAVAIAAGENHTCAILDDGSAKCWGQNTGGRLGTGNSTWLYAPPANPIDLGPGRTALAIHAGGGHTCVLLDNGVVKCFGYNTVGQIGTGSVWNLSYSPVVVDLGTGKIAVGLGGGYSHTCAILSEGSLKCWGQNNAGALGLGDMNNRGDNPNEMGDNLPTVKLFSSEW